jgi:Sporulation and spore germination.
MRKRALALFLMLALLLQLSGCQSAIPVIRTEDVESPAFGGLATPEMAYPAPSGDAHLEYYGTAALYLPRKDGTRLTARYAEMTFSAARHEAETVLRALLSFPETEDTLPVGQGVVSPQLIGNTPVEISHDVCTVNLAPSCSALDTEQFLTLCQAITNTLTEFLDIRYVNILVAGRQVGLDIASMLPMGTLQRRLGEDLTNLYSRIDVQRVKNDESHEEKRFTAAATLYYPAAVGNGILPEVRTVSFEGQTPAQMAKALISELSQGAQLLTSMPALPNLSGFLAELPTVTEQGTGGRIAQLKFTAPLNEALVESSITRSALMASLTYTLCTFIPELSGITVLIGEEFITSVTPFSIYTTGETIQFNQGEQTRADYSRLLLGLATLYFADADGTRLVPVKRPVPYYEVRNPRYLLSQLAQGPKPYDDFSGVQPVLPANIRDADYLGFAVHADTLFVNLSNDFKLACQGMEEQTERLLIYAMVNTLTQKGSFKQVAFFVADKQPESLCGGLYLPGVFIQNSGIVRAR